MALLALVKPLAGIGRHLFCLAEPAFKAGDDGFQNTYFHVCNYIF